MYTCDGHFALSLSFLFLLFFLLLALNYLRMFYLVERKIVSFSLNCFYVNWLLSCGMFAIENNYLRLVEKFYKTMNNDICILSSSLKGLILFLQVSYKTLMNLQKLSL